MPSSRPASALCALSARRTRGLLAALACTMLAVASSAAWGLSAHATLDWSAFDISVIDIDAGDGIQASYSFNALASRTARCLDDSAICPGGVPGASADDWSSHGAETGQVGGLWGSASYSADSLQAMAAGSSPRGERSMGASRSALLTLEGASEVTISIPYTLSVDASGGDARHSSFAYAGLIVSSVGIANSRLFTPVDGSSSDSQVLRLHWTNPSDHAASYLGADAFAQLVASPVPEPAPLVPMAAGLAVLAACWRRRRVRAEALRA